MTSSRNSRRDDDILLDAARECVLRVGLRRTTLTDVASQAGVSRMTMYRRWPDMKSLVGDLMTQGYLRVNTIAGDSMTISERRELLTRTLAGLRAL